VRFSHLLILGSWGGLAEQDAIPVWRQQLMMVSAVTASQLSFVLSAAARLSHPTWRRRLMTVGTEALGVHCVS